MKIKELFSNGANTTFCPNEILSLVNDEWTKLPNCFFADYANRLILRPNFGKERNAILGKRICHLLHTFKQSISRLKIGLSFHSNPPPTLSLSLLPFMANSLLSFQPENFYNNIFSIGQSGPLFRLFQCHIGEIFLY